MAENFDLIFGQNASQQYAWSDNDYQNGWETIGSIPPTAAQFDALQRRSDTKMKELNDELTPLVNAETADNRQPATEYSEGTIKYTPLLPTGWFLECTVAGTTSASDLVITSPAIGDTVTDDTVVWTIRKVADTTDATTTTHGLMSASDKTKLNGIEANANKYTLPTASASVKGGIKVGSGLSMSGETLNNTYSYTLPTASSSVKGGIKIGSGLSMDGETLNNAYSLPAATGSVRGGVTIGSNISLSGDKISLTSGNVTNALGYTPPSTTGANASGSWNINSATATKLATPRTISLTGKAAGSTSFDGSSNAAINVTSVNADTATHANNVTDAIIDYGASGIGEGTTAMASGTIYDLTDLTSMNKLRSFVGSVNANDWYDVISVRHRNGAEDGQIYGLLMYSGLTNTDSIKYKKQIGNSGWTEERTLLDSSNYNSYAPTKTGAGASGTWNINITGNAASATNATKIVNNGNRNDIANGAKAPSGLSVYQCYVNTGYPQEYGNVVSIGGTGDNELFLGWKDDARLLYRSKVDVQNNWTNWRAIAFTDEINNYAPTKTGAGASGTWNISVSGSAASATNADKLDGYHAADLLRTLGGNKAPVMTDIFDRAGTIDLSAMNATDKANAKAKINKSRNSLQNLWNTSTGIVAYGGDIDMSGGYHIGTLKLTQSYKNFDKILVVGTNDDANIVFYKLWNVYELIYAFSHSVRFPLYNEGSYWFVYGSVRTGTATDYVLSTDTIWSCNEQGAGIIAIYGIKY